MGEMIYDNGTMRELVEVQRKPCKGNESGIVRIYRDQMLEGDTVVGEAPPVAEKPKAKNERKAGQ